MPKHHKHPQKKESLTDTPQTFFKRQREAAGVTQTVRVEVNVSQADDCVTSCFKGLARVFKKSG